jgi:mRNA-degrading endonuclease RelE of RelBE toxin-antitoxin system
MEFRIADTFTAGLDKLANEEQKAVKLTAFELQMNPAHPGLQFHKLDRAKDKNFWSVRVNRDVRLIVHKTDASLLLCYVDHHDDAYAWAERRKLERHPKTGAAQLVEVRETVREIPIPRYVEAPEPVEPAEPQEKAPAKPLFAEVSEAAGPAGAELGGEKGSVDARNRTTVGTALLPLDHRTRGRHR